MTANILTIKLITGRGPGRQVRLRLGRNWLRLLRRIILLLAGDEGPVFPRDRHPVQASCPCSQVEGYRCRHQRRRVDGHAFFILALGSGPNISRL